MQIIISLFLSLVGLSVNANATPSQTYDIRAELIKKNANGDVIVYTPKLVIHNVAYYFSLPGPDIVCKHFTGKKHFCYTTNLREGSVDAVEYDYSGQFFPVVTRDTLDSVKCLGSFDPNVEKCGLGYPKN